MVVNTLQFVGLLVESRQPVPRAEDNANDLGQTEQEVDELGHKEQHHGLAKVAQDADHRESHACAVAEGVAHKHFGGEPVVLKQS